MIINAKDYIAPDGLMNLTVNNNRAPYLSGLPDTSNNDNGILFISEFYWLCHLNTQLLPDYVPNFMLSVLLLEVTGYSGLYNRNPGRSQDTEAFDDYVGIVASSVLFNNKYPADICNYGKSNGWMFDNTNPTKPHIDCWRQGSEIAYYQICNKEIPELWNFAWLIISTFISSFNIMKDLSSPLLNWLKFRSIKMLVDEKRLAINFPLWMICLLYIVGGFWLWKLKAVTKGKGMESIFAGYFTDPNHPNVLLSKGIVV
jgi:hypothetical protein